MTDLAGVNLSMFRFDYNLTFAVLLMNADGTIYHTFGGRDRSDAMSHLTMPALVQLLRDTVAEHEAYQKDPKPPQLPKRFTIEQYPTLARRIKTGKKPDCMHCHMVGEYKYSSWKEQGRYRLEDFMNYPDPVVIGLRLEQEPQTVVAEVVQGSPAAKAGLQAGDRIVQIGAAKVSTFGDIQRALHEASPKPGSLAVEVRRGDATLSKTLRLAKRWKFMEPLDFAWRPDKWAMWPRPGMGGRRLSDADLKQHGLAPGTFAIKITYVVDWGENRFLGQAAKQAGVKRNQTILLGVDGKRDFQSEAHFQAWFRMTRRLGVPVKLEVLQNGRRKVLTLVPVDR